MATTAERPLVAKPLEDLPSAPLDDSGTVTADEPVHIPDSRKTMFLSDLVEEVIADWPKSKDFTPTQIHEKALELADKKDVLITTQKLTTTQQKIGAMAGKGQVERVARGRYVKVDAPTPVEKKPSAKKHAAKPKKAQANKKAPKKVVAKKTAARKVTKETPKEEPAPSTPQPMDSNRRLKVLLNESTEEGNKISVEEAFNFFLLISQTQKTTNPIYWHHVGTMCSTAQAMISVLKNDGE